MHILTICNHKGGTGKTTSVVALAAALQRSGQRVLVLDLDPQAFLTRLMGIAEPEEHKSTLALFDPSVQASTIPLKTLSGFDIMPASLRLTDAMRTLTRPTDLYWISEALQEIRGYDIIMLDTAAAITPISLNAIIASTALLIPVTPEYLPVTGAEQTYHTLQTLKKRIGVNLNHVYFLLTNVWQQRGTHRRFVQYLRQKYFHKVLQTFIRTDTALAMTRADGTNIYDHQPESRGATDYTQAANELSNLLGITRQREHIAQQPKLDAGTNETDKQAQAFLDRLGSA